jgi:hypothetical protein
MSAVISNMEKGSSLPPVVLPETYNYTACFLTLACNLDCSYCINLHEDFSQGRRRIITQHLGAQEWIAAIDRIETGGRMPITLQGGEPTVFKHFYAIVEGVRDDVRFDLLTNLQFDAEEFVRRVPKHKFAREAPYGMIRVSYHPGQNTMEEIIPKTLRLMEHGFRVSVYGVLEPSIRDEVLRAKERSLTLGIDFRTKEYLGVQEGTAHGVYRYAGAIEGLFNKYCDCKTTELLISPAGYAFRCHSDLYEARPPVGHILDPEFQVEDLFRPCYVYGHCNPCDVKVKTNRFQEYGHTSCEIVRIRELTSEEEERRRTGDNGMVDWSRGRKLSERLRSVYHDATTVRTGRT